MPNLNLEQHLKTASTTASTMASKCYNAVKTTYVLDVPTCSPMYKKSVELMELRHFQSIDGYAPLVEAKIKKINNSFSPTQLKKMDEIIEVLNKKII